MDLQLIEAVTNPRGEAQYKNELTQAVDRLLDQRADVKAATSDGATALIIAAQNGHTEIVDQLRDFLNGFTETLNPLFDRESLLKRHGKAEQKVPLLQPPQQQQKPQQKSTILGKIGKNSGSLSC